VDFPAPERPTRPTRSPGAMARLMPCRTRARCRSRSAGPRSDPAALDGEHLSARAVGHLARHGNRAHAVLHGADVLEDRRHVLRHPARDVGDLCQVSGNAMATVPMAMRRRSTARSPLPRAHHQWSRLRVVRVKLKKVMSRSCRRNASVLVDGGAHEGVLVGGPGEQLHCQDVGVAVDDAAGEGGAHFRHPLRSGRACAARKRAAARYIPRPQQAPAPPGGRRSRPSARMALRRRPGCTRPRWCAATTLSRSDGPVCMTRLAMAAGEVVLEEGPALAHHVPVALQRIQGW